MSMNDVHSLINGYDNLVDLMVHKWTSHDLLAFENEARNPLPQKKFHNWWQTHPPLKSLEMTVNEFFGGEIGKTVMDSNHD